MTTEDKDLTLADACGKYVIWLREARGLSTHTQRAYRSDVLALARSLGPQMAVTDLCAAGIVRFFERQRTDGIGSNSLRRRAASIRGFCAFLRTKELVSGNPWPSDTLEFPRVRSLPRAVSGPDLERLLAHLMSEAAIGRRPPSDRPLARPQQATTLLAASIMLTTGLRVSEMTSCTLGDLDLNRHSIHILGKGQRERVVYFPDQWLAALVSAYLVTREALDIEHDHFLFSASRQPLTARAIRLRIARAGRSAGLRQHLTPHMLRHSAATQLIESGVNIRYVQRLLGHASLATTEIYTHVTDDALQDALRNAKVLRRHTRGR
jgi:site-specific recombinase XerD